MKELTILVPVMAIVSLVNSSSTHELLLIPGNGSEDANNE